MTDGVPETTQAVATPASPKPDDTTKPEKLPIRLVMTKGGMFRAVSTAGHLLHLAEQDGHDVVVRWPESVYKDPEMRGDPWEYFFEPPMTDYAGPIGKLTGINSLYPGTVTSTEHIFSPRIFRGIAESQDLPKDRHLGHSILTKFIRPKAYVRAMADDFQTAFLNRPFVGLHLRGPGRLHGGADVMRDLLQPGEPIPYKFYFKAVRRALRQNRRALVFACSDSQDVIDRVRQEFGKRVVTYPSTRSRFGEMHESHPENEGAVYSPFKLGLDVLVEAMLLARARHFVHGNSNVSNYVLCAAPDMPSTFVYEPIMGKYKERMRAELAQQKQAAKG